MAVAESSLAPVPEPDPYDAVRSATLTAPPIYDPSLTAPFAPDTPNTDPVPAAGPEPLSTRRIILWVTMAAVLASALSLAAFQLLGGGSGRGQSVVSLGGSSGQEAGENLNLSGTALDVQAVLNFVRESVVTIDTNQETRVGIFGGAGSGVVISDDGLILTNEHVVRDADVIDVTFFNGLTFQATLVGSSVRDDVAVLQVQGVTDTRPAVLGSVETLRVGDEVLAIGNALGFGGEPTVTRGIVSAKNRTLDEPGLDFESLIQTDAAINPGNSGGPLVNAAGEVVGINTAIIEGAQNIGFAISIDSIMPLINRMVGGDAELTPAMASLGASTLSVAQVPPGDLALFAVSGENGAFVVDVIPGSSAEQAGLLRGDVILRVDGSDVSAPEDVARAVRRRDPGERIELTILRDGLELEMDVTLGTRPIAGN